MVGIQASSPAKVSLYLPFDKQIRQSQPLVGQVGIQVDVLLFRLITRLH